MEQRFNPGMVDVLCRLAEVMREENHYWDELVREAMEEVVQEGEEFPLTVRVDRLQPMPLGLKRRVIYQILRRAGGRRVSWDDVERVIGLLSQRESGRRVPVSGGRWVRKSYDVLEFEVEEKPRDSSVMNWRFPVAPRSRDRHCCRPGCCQQHRRLRPVRPRFDWEP